MSRPSPSSIAAALPPDRSRPSRRYRPVLRHVVAARPIPSTVVVVEYL